MRKLFLLLGWLVLSGVCANASGESGIVDCPKSNVLDSMDYQSGEPIRLFTKSGELLSFILPEDTENVEVVETPRSTRIAKDLVVFRDIAKKVAGVGEIDKRSSDKSREEVSKCFQYRQRHDRSVLTITPKQGKSGKDEMKLGKADFILGKEEHLWMSADMGLTNIKQLTLDKNGNPTEKEKPASFYIGVNYKVGDVFLPENKLSVLDRLSAKFMFHVSTTPSDSMGVGLAYELDVATVFVARVWTKNDAVVGSSLGTTQSTLAGISFDISKGLDWVSQ